MRFKTCTSGFSLVEVVMALGIASFALLAVVGLLPVGMKSAQDAREQAAAANVINSIANALRSAERMNAGNYSNSYAGKTIAFTVGGAQTNVSWDDLDLYGNNASTPMSARFKARLVIEPPSSENTTGSALISIAWPAHSTKLVWNETNWANAQGTLCTGVQFLPGK
jgi:Tfp pilus assembly protein PilV